MERRWDGTAIGLGVGGVVWEPDSGDVRTLWNAKSDILKRSVDVSSIMAELLSSGNMSGLGRRRQHDNDVEYRPRLPRSKIGRSSQDFAQKTLHAFSTCTRGQYRPSTPLTN
jgi:hypothetical protein